MIFAVIIYLLEKAFNNPYLEYGLQLF